ncbi:MAG: gliding motility-associated protein GldE [Bacteroidia bacterium]|nr:MAG: gliding motility-associated protein GldE [Bacteroidia bacterium]
MVADPLDFKLIFGFVVLAILLFISALMSGSEVAFFSLRPEDIEKLKVNKSKKAAMVLKLHDMPDKLLSTILVANNTVNIAIVLLAAFLSARLFDFSTSPVLGFLIEAGVITFILLFFGEVMPKVFATKNQIPMSLFMAFPMSFLQKLFKPLTSLLILSTSFVKKRAVHRKTKISMDDLSDALELAADDINEDEKILKGIVNFGNINVSEIMRPRIDVTAINIKFGFNKVKSIIIDSGFSRIPVYSGSFDSVKGILYAKDVLPYTNSPDNFKWQALMRPVHFVPETKKINELLKDFQIRKIHMAVVIDEYGGTSGIITLEDVLEEIVGEITDESDEDETMHHKIDDKTYIFEGKILLNDFFKIIDVEDDPFEDVRGESETLAGLILELTGEIPQKGQTITYLNFNFRIESADKRRIKEIRVELTDEDGEKKED